jgi:WD40 repeat protein
MKILSGSFLFVLAALVLAGSAGPAVSRSQKIVFGSDRAEGQRDLYVVNEDGSGERRLTFDGEDYRERTAVWSPDGSRIAYTALHNGNADVYTIDANGGDRRRVTTDPAREDDPHWTSDGRILFTRDLFAPPASVWVVNADGTNERQLALVGSAASAEGAPSGDRIVYSSTTTGPSVLRVAQLGKDGSVTNDVAITTPPNDGGGDFEPHWSPNGSDIVFERDRGDVDNDVFVVHSDGSGLKRLTDTPGRPEFWATWSSDGKEVLFQDGNTQKLRAINVATGQERAVSTWPRAPLTDDFGDGVRDASLWHQINDPGGTVSETGGQTVLTISAGAVPGGQYDQVDEHIGSQCSLVGDFDYQVDYSLLTWPHLGGFRANLAGFFANASIGRASVPIPWAPSWNDEQVQGYSDGGGGQFASSDSSGTLRLVRSGGIVTGYVKLGGGWRPAFSGAATGDTVYGVDLSASAAEFGHLDGSVAFDNFKLTSGTLRCPDWWNDFFPDVYFG